MLLITLLSALLFQDVPPPAHPPADYVAGPQDVLSVVVFGEADLTRTVAIDPDGTFEFPLIGRVAAAGLTARAVADAVAAKLRDLYVHPQVTVEVVKFRSQHVFVFGQVHAPGQYPLAGSMSVLQALAAAGSPTASAASFVLISRPAGAGPGLPQPETGGGSSLRITLRQLQAGQVPPMFALRDGDTVTVPKAATVYVTGHVKSPGPYAIDEALTVMQVIAMAGGVSEKGAMNRTKIFRALDGTLQEVKGVKLSDPVQAGDTVDIPQRYF